MEAQRQALAYLMSQVPSNESGRGHGHRSEEPWQGYEDRSVCQWFLCSDFCLFELFHGTKEQVGICMNKHDVVVRKSYLRARKHLRPEIGLDKYESSCLRRLERMIEERDVMIEKLRAQADDAAEEALRDDKGEQQTGDCESSARIELLGREAQGKTQTAEELGSQGLVREASEALAEASRLASERDALSMIKAKAAQIRIKQKALDRLRRPCEVCGAMLPINVDNDFIRGHRRGRIHQGWVKVREEYARLKRLEEKGGKQWLHILGLEDEAPIPGRVREAAQRRRAHRDIGGSRALLLDSHGSPRSDRCTERCQKRGRSRSRSKRSRDRRRRGGSSREARRSREAKARRSREAKAQSSVLSEQNDDELEEEGKLEEEGELEEGEQDLEEGEL